jgi:hypothetical protein
LAWELVQTGNMAWLYEKVVVEMHSFEKQTIEMFYPYLLPASSV